MSKRRRRRRFDVVNTLLLPRVPAALPQLHVADAETSDKFRNKWSLIKWMFSNRWNENPLTLVLRAGQA